MLLLSPTKQHDRDAEKRAKCLRNGITLIEVPYWWNGKIRSLVGTVLRLRPELTLDNPAGEFIPPKPPTHKEKQEGTLHNTMRDCSGDTVLNDRHILMKLCI
jgi:hypothetical protein